MKIKIPSLDGWRALSIFFVLCSHLQYSYGIPSELQFLLKTIFNDGILGVQCFFIISGFIITLLLIEEFDKNGKNNLKYFYIRRVLRIFPLYFLYLLVIYCLQTTTIFSQSNAVWIENLTFTTGIGYPSIHSWPTGHLWSLAVEEQFYLIWPILFVVLKLYHRQNLAFSILAFPVIFAPFCRVITYVHFNNDILLFILNIFSFLNNCDSLSFGCIAAFIYKKYNRYYDQQTIFVKYTYLIIGIASIIVPAILRKFYLCGFFTVPFGNTLQSIGFVILILQSIRSYAEFPYRILNSRFFVTVGLLSFSIYIWQQIFIKPSIFGFESSLFFTFPGCLASIIVCSIISYYIIEKPISKLKKHFVSIGS